jgi:pSer/pThr/pTyr-binding forkhead associated (FHA) protein
LLIGKQLLRFEMEAPSPSQAPASVSQTLVLGSLIGKYEAKLVKRLPNGKDSNEYPLTEPVTSIGREKGEILFRNDPFVSGKHARIQLEAGSYSVEDLNSSNGTYVRLRQKEEIGHEDFFIVGEQLFQVRLQIR